MRYGFPINIRSIRTGPGLFYLEVFRRETEYQNYRSYAVEDCGAQNKIDEISRGCFNLQAQIAQKIYR